MTRRWRRLGLLLLLPAAVALRIAAGERPDLVERLYAHDLYPSLVAILARASAAVPFSLAEWAAGLLGLALAASAGVGLLRGVRGGRLGGVLVTGGIRALGLAGLVYLWFLMAWGLNHQRPSFASQAGLDASPAAVEELRALCGELIEATDEARAGLEEDADGVMRLSGGRAAALARAGLGFAAAAQSGLPIPAGPPAALKQPLVSPLLWRMGITGIYVPFTGEAHVNATLPDPELPFAASHELAHLRGFAREDEASYVGYAACLRHPDPDFRYSGLLAASLYAMAQLHGVDRDAYGELFHRRSVAVRRDVDALTAWSSRYRGPVRQAARRVNDAYLKSQGQTEGVRSYGRVVDLLLAERRARLASGQAE